jgi:chromate transporter
VIAPRTTALSEIARVFLKLGVVGFGGPAAHVALMRQEVVERRGWLTEEAFLDYLAASNLLPGPTSTELAIHIGHDRAGWRGLLVAGSCFIVPASLIVSAAAWGYVRYGTLPAVEGVLYGVKPVVIAVVVQALWSLARTALKSRWLAALGVASLAAVALGTPARPRRYGAGRGERRAGGRFPWQGSRCWRRRRPRWGPRRRWGSSACS